jgi:hypothetical protein
MNLTFEHTAYYSLCFEQSNNEEDRPAGSSKQPDSKPSLEVPDLERIPYFMTSISSFCMVW